MNDINIIRFIIIYIILTKYISNFKKKIYIYILIHLFLIRLNISYSFYIYLSISYSA